MMNHVRELSLAERDVRQTYARFEVSTIELDNFLQRVTRLPRIATLEKTLTNQRQQHQIVLRPDTRQTQRRPRSRKQTRIRLRTRLRAQQTRKVVDQPRAIRTHFQRTPK